MANIKILALGGLGENGKNMYVVEVEDQIFILDAGLKFPDIDMYGVDGVIANIDYLIEHKNKIKGVFVSHGHEDNIGAIPYLLRTLQVKVFGSHFTISIIESLLASYHMDVSKYKLFRVNDNKVMKFSNVLVTFFNTTHSIPESLGICIETVDGVIVYCTDFNFASPNDGIYQTTFSKITDLGKKKVLALLSESLNSGQIGRIANDSLLEHNFNYELTHNPGRIILGAYSTDLIRIQKTIDLAVAQNRKIAIVTRNAKNLIEVAIKSLYLRIPEENFVNITDLSHDEVSKLTNIVIIVTGFRNEPYASLVRMVELTDDIIHITEEDKVVIMCPPVPGTERLATESLNTLCQHNITISVFDKDVLKSSHASPEDLKMLYSMLKPEYLIPIKGEYRHMYDQYLVASNSNIDKNRILLLENGQIVRFTNGQLLDDIMSIPVGDIYIDGYSYGQVDNFVVEERTRLAEEGVVFIRGCIDLVNKKIVSSINLSTKGFSSQFSDEELTSSFGGLLERIVTNSLSKKVFDKESVELGLCEELRKQIVRFTKHRPIIIPVIQTIDK